MNKAGFYSIVLYFSLTWGLISCSEQQNTSDGITQNSSDPGNYLEERDYVLFERVRILDKTAFVEPAEAYSMLLPKGWKQESTILWNPPGSSCAGTFYELHATSANGKYSFRIMPDVVFSWNTNPELMQFYQYNSSSSSSCAIGQPFNAEQYFRSIFSPRELGNPEILKVEANPLVVKEMEQSNEKNRRELMQYGSSGIEFNQSAINAHVRWPNGTEGMVVLGVTVVENTVPNVYNGSHDKIYSTQVSKRMVFTYPEDESKAALNQFAVIMGSIRSNPSYSETINNYWRDVRQKKHIEHIGQLKMMDDQTSAIGKSAIQQGNARLQAMDTELRSWELRQDAQDRMHTGFVKTIREVENYQDATGKVELASGYNHAWSRGDGSTFIMSNNPAFNPGTVFQDQNWQPMKKVD